MSDVDGAKVAQFVSMASQFSIDGSDKEMFDAQMIEKLKKKVSDLEAMRKEARELITSYDGEVQRLKDRVSRLELHLSRCLLDIEHSDKWYEREEAYEKRYAESLALVRGGR
jgi:chromosome segregation ATPase